MGSSDLHNLAFISLDIKSHVVSLKTTTNYFI